MATRVPVENLGYGFRKSTVIVLALLVVVGIGGTACFRSDGVTRIGRAKSDVDTIDEACAAYRQNNGRFPAALKDLVSGSKPYLEGGEEAIIDPWGNPYQFDLNGPHSDGAKPDIFTVDPDGQTIGNWQKRKG